MLNKLKDKISNAINFRKFYESSGRLLNKLSYIDNTVTSHKEIEKFKSISIRLIDNLHTTLKYIKDNEKVLKKHEGLNPSITIKMTDIINKIDSSHSDARSIKEKYERHQNLIQDIEYFTKTVGTSNQEIRMHIEKESFDKAADLQHKITLTLLRALQIPIFIFITYISIYGVVKLLGEKDLVIPRGLISIVPSGLEQNAQNLAKSQEKSENTSSEISATP